MNEPILDRVRNCIRNVLCVNLTDIGPETDIADIGADEFDAAAIWWAVEDEFGVDTRSMALTTARQIADWLQPQLPLTGSATA